MSRFFQLFKPHRAHNERGSPDNDPASGHVPSSRDTRAAIEELSQVVRNNPDAVEIYLALGNLYRSQGDLERAIQIRNTLIVRQGLDQGFKARAWLELGRDYKRAGFLDRSMHALEQARKTLHNDPSILAELLRVSAISNDFLQAAEYASLLGNATAQAYYLVLEAKKFPIPQKMSRRTKLLKRALSVNPESAEAWLELIKDEYAQASWSSLGKKMQQAMKSVPPHLRFLLLEGLIDFSLTHSENEAAMPPKCVAKILPVIEELPQDLLLYYYGALFLIQSQDHDQARQWLEKTLILNPDFWPARLELLDQSMELQELSAGFKIQLEFFLEKARMVKKFVCSSCGLKRERIFFHCPRCEAWHSISFRVTLND